MGDVRIDLALLASVTSCIVALESIVEYRFNLICLSYFHIYYFYVDYYLKEYRNPRVFAIVGVLIDCSYIHRSSLCAIILSTLVID
jgi:hypothetical protein